MLDKVIVDRMGLSEEAIEVLNNDGLSHYIIELTDLGVVIIGSKSIGVLESAQRYYDMVGEEMTNESTIYVVIPGSELSKLPAGMDRICEDHHDLVTNIFSTLMKSPGSRATVVLDLWKYVITSTSIEYMETTVLNAATILMNSPDVSDVMVLLETE